MSRSGYFLQILKRKVSRWTISEFETRRVRWVFWFNCTNVVHTPWCSPTRRKFWKRHFSTCFQYSSIYYNGAGLIHINVFCKINHLCLNKILNFKMLKTCMCMSPTLQKKKTNTIASIEFEHEWEHCKILFLEQKWSVTIMEHVRDYIYE